MTSTLPTAPSGAEAVPRDATHILAARGVRQFAYGLLAVALAVALTRDGFSPPAIGAIITVSLVGDFCGTYLVALYGDRWPGASVCSTQWSSAICPQMCCCCWCR